MPEIDFSIDLQEKRNKIAEIRLRLESNFTMRSEDVEWLMTKLTEIIDTAEHVGSSPSPEAFAYLQQLRETHIDHIHDLERKLKRRDPARLAAAEANADEANKRAAQAIKAQARNEGDLFRAITAEEALAAAREALTEAAEIQPRMIETLRRNGVVFDGPLGNDPKNWQHVAFSIYTALCAVDSIVCAALAAVRRALEK